MPLQRSRSSKLATLQGFNESSQDNSSAPTLLQYVMALTKEHHQFGPLRWNQSDSEHAGSDRNRILEALDAESTALFEEWHTLEHQSVQRLKSMAAQSANFSSSKFLEQVTAQSAGIIAEMQALEQLSATLKGKAVPAHLFPQVHVASRRPGGDLKQPSAQRAAADDRAVEVSQSSVGAVRLGLTLAGLFVVVVSAILTANRKTVAVAAGLKLGDRAGSACGKPRIAHTSHCGHEQASKALSVWDGTVATFSTIVGTGLLAMPYAFSLAGMVAVPVVLFFVCCSAYTAHLMAWALNAHSEEAELRGLKPSMRGWGFLVEVAFGRKAKSAINAFLIVELWGYLLSSTVCSAMNIVQVAEDMHISTAVGLSICVCYALTFVPVHLLTRVNVLSNAVFMACCVMFLITGLLLPQTAPPSDIKWIDPRGLLSAAGILVFSPAGHGFYPSLMQSMEEPAKFPMCVRRAYIAAVLLYLVVAVSGYHLFGHAVQPSAVQNIGADLHLMPIPHLGWMNTLSACGMVIKMLAMQALVLPPLSSTVEGVLVGHSQDVSISVLVAPGILTVSAGVAVHFASEMALLLNLIGSVFCMNIAFVVPVVCYWKLARRPVGALRQAVFIALILLGGTFALLGVMTAL